MEVLLAVTLLEAHQGKFSCRAMVDKFGQVSCSPDRGFSRLAKSSKGWPRVTPGRWFSGLAEGFQGWSRVFRASRGLSELVEGF